VLEPVVPRIERVFASAAAPVSMTRPSPSTWVTVDVAPQARYRLSGNETLGRALARRPGTPR
jgi:hypothetical protein